MAEQKMKTTVTSMYSVNKKEVHCLEHQKALYEKRRAELKRSLAADQDSDEKITLHRGMPRSPSPRPEIRYDRSRSPSPRFETRYDRSRSPSPRPDTRYDRSRSRYDISQSSTLKPDLQPRPTSSFNRQLSESTSFTTITELNNKLHSGKSNVRQRSISLINAPSIEISEVDDDESTKLKLPPISPSPSGLKAEILHPQRRKSTGGLPIEAGRNPRRPSLTRGSEPLSPKTAVAVRSQRNTGIGSPGTQLPRGITRKNMSNEMKDLNGILKILDDVKQKNVPDLDTIGMRSNASCVKKQNSLGNEPMNVEHVYDAVAKNDEREDQQKENKMADSAMDDSQEGDNLASSMDKLKFCTYLRGNEIDLDKEQNLPTELVPGSLIIGHTKIALHNK